MQEYFSQIPGCYFTNDAAVKDDDGHFWVIGRVDDVINVAGHRLSTMEMESAIMECGGIAEVAVVGMPDAIKGLVPAAFVTLKSGRVGLCRAPRHAIRDQVARAIGRIAMPEYAVLHRRAAEDAERQDHAPAAEGDCRDRRHGLRHDGARRSIVDREAEGHGQGAALTRPRG